MIDFSTGYSFRDILTQLLNQVPDELDKREGSLIYTSLAPIAWYLEGLYMTLNKVQRSASVETAEGNDLDLLVANRGIERKPATPAVRKGVFDAAIPEGTLFRTVNGSNSVDFLSGDLISAINGTYYYEMTCTTAGTIGNTYSGRIIPALSGIPGLTTAEIGEVITEGADTETNESLYNRYMASFNAAPYGGNIATYKQAILAIPGVGAVQVYPANYFSGGGNVLCSIINSDYEPASEALVATVQSVINPYPETNLPNPAIPNDGFGIAPCGAAVKVVSGTATDIDVSVTIEFVNTIIDTAPYYDGIENAIRDYIKTVAKGWGTPREDLVIDYPVTLYRARLIYSIMAAVPEVVNVTSVTLNGAAEDMTLTENATVQQVPVPGRITINENA